MWYVGVWSYQRYYRKGFQKSKLWRLDYFAWADSNHMKKWVKIIPCGSNVYHMCDKWHLSIACSFFLSFNQNELVSESPLQNKWNAAPKVRPRHKSAWQIVSQTFGKLWCRTERKNSWATLAHLRCGNIPNADLSIGIVLKLRRGTLIRTQANETYP